MKVYMRYFLLSPWKLDSAEFCFFIESHVFQLQASVSLFFHWLVPPELIKMADYRITLEKIWCTTSHTPRTGRLGKYNFGICFRNSIGKPCHEYASNVLLSPLLDEPTVVTCLTTWSAHPLLLLLTWWLADHIVNVRVVSSWDWDFCSSIVHDH